MSSTATESSINTTVAGYREEGYLVLRNAFGREEVTAWQAECDRLGGDETIVNKANLRTPFRNGATQNPERIDPVIDISPVFRSLAYDPRVTNVVKEILGGNEPTIWKDKIIFKDPGVSGYAMHQDGSWWQGLDVPLEELLSVMIAIDGAAADNGCLELFPGYHHKLLSAAGEIRNMNDAEAAPIDLTSGMLMETEPGDVIIFHALAPHRSGKNTSDRSRRQFYLTYANGRFGDHYQKQREHYLAYTQRNLTDEQRRTIFFK